MLLVTLSAAALAAALAGLLPPGLALAVAGLVAAARAATLLLRRDGSASWQRPISAGLGFCGVSTAAAGIADWAAPDATLGDVPLPAELPLIGLFFVAGTLLVGLFHLPGQAATYIGRVRRLLDGVGIGVILFFIAWLVVFEAAGLRGAALTAVLVASVAVGAAVVGTMRAAPIQPGAALRGVGALTMIIGQTALILILDYHLEPGWLLPAGVPLVAGPLLAGRRLPPGPPEPAAPTPADGSFARYPLLALPLAGALVAAAYHLVVAGRFDPVSAVLAIVGVVIIAVREALAVADVRQYARWIAEREARFRALVAGSADVTMMLDDTLVVRWQSPAAARRLGLADADVLGRPLLDRVHPDETEAVTAALTSGDTLIEARLGDGFGVWRETEWSVSDQRADPSVRAVVVHVRDISQRRQLEHALRQAARSDHLTGLANRTELRRLLTERTAPCVLAVLGLDGLTSVNQLRGHEVGDAVLVEAARRLRAALAPGEVAARLAGEQFAVLTPGGAVHAQMTASRLLTLLSDPYPVLGVASHLSASAGLAEHVPGDTDASGSALSRAELALQRARQLGPAQPPQWYDEATAALLRRRLTIEQDLPGALLRGELDLLFQPVVELPSGRVVGVEARPRWRRAGLGPVADTEFLPVADQLGLHHELGAWMLAAAGRQLAGAGAAAGSGAPLWLAVTVSPALLAAGGFVDLVAATGFPASRLVVQFSVPEPELPDLVDRLTAIRTLGARTALDGFGIQATSLSLLRRLPLDLVRVDRRAFAGAETAVVAAVVNLARQLGVEVAVDGVRDEEELATITAAGCRLAQGSLFCGASVPERLEAYLDAQRAARP